ncbi:hypothetical protein PUN28_008397 [Cardiocondyla obscurior]|uniref:Secreted protein n=1 Tax=Cardiocondyla obscurior TaxID=286306 RepID=A0AAW2G080_9HYME
MYFRKTCAFVLCFIATTIRTCFAQIFNRMVNTNIYRFRSWTSAGFDMTEAINGRGCLNLITLSPPLCFNFYDLFYIYLYFIKFRSK